MASRVLSSKHEALVESILAEIPGTKTRRFRAALNELCAELGMPAFDHLGWLPDAYRINRQACEIELYEVEVHHSLPDWKIDALGEFWFEWDCYGAHDWLPVLIIVSRYGVRQRFDLKHADYRTGPFAR